MKLEKINPDSFMATLMGSLEVKEVENQRPLHALYANLFPHSIVLLSEEHEEMGTIMPSEYATISETKVAKGVGDIVFEHITIHKVIVSETNSKKLLICPPELYHSLADKSNACYPTHIVMEDGILYVFGLSI